MKQIIHGIAVPRVADSVESFDVGSRLRELRELKRVNIRQLSLAAKVSATSVDRIESGVSGATIKVLEKLTHALGVSLAEFFGPMDIAEQRVQLYDKVTLDKLCSELLLKILTGQELQKNTVLPTRGSLRSLVKRRKAPCEAGRGRLVFQEQMKAKKA
jgi:transcriptional regulator with XRE-family HTH domain